MSVLSNEELCEMIARLEQQELDCQTGSGVVPVSVYSELLAAYLASDPPNLAQAKFLMQRVPDSIKQSEEGAELNKLWKIGKNLWTRNISEVYTCIGGPWSPSVQKIIEKLTYSLKQTNLKLVGDAYSSIKISQVASMLGVTEQEAVVAAEREGWGVNTQSGVLMPKRSTEDRSLSNTTEHQMEKIINFVSYLEN